MATEMRSLVLGFIVVGVVPGVLLVLSGWNPIAPPMTRVVVSVGLLGVGLAMVAWTVALFASAGRRLAPWESTRGRGVADSHSHVRNPIITGIAAVLAGEALLFASWWVAAWGLVFVIGNHVYLAFSEEPGLARRFGREYVEYARNVPRWIPSWRAWRPQEPVESRPDGEGSKLGHVRAASNRPRVFLSSTVYDFADLRSAIKFWLEELGYDVDASEFNDFLKEADKNSYDACLKTIDQANYFVLLIGSRAGGWYDEATKMTITMKEYRHAYERAKRGELKLLTFVRRSVWDVREDREALGRVLKTDYMKEHNLSDEDISRIKHHESRLVSNAETVFAFVAEVARNAEMKAAAAGKGALPPANWVHRFEGFRDIVDALRIDLGGALGLRRVALTANLQHELVENLRHLLQRMPSDGTVEPAYRWASHARDQFSGGPKDKSRIKGKRLMWLSMFALTGAKVGGQLATQFLDEALVSGEFLDFDRATDRYVVGKLQGSMITLKEDILRLRREGAALSFEEQLKMVESFRPLKDVDTLVEAENSLLVGTVSIHDRQMNVVALSAAILKALEGDDAHLGVVKLHHGTPFAEEAVQIERETPTAKDVVVWLNSTLKPKS